MSNLKRFFLIIAIILGLAALALLAYSWLGPAGESKFPTNEQETGSSTPLEDIPLAPAASNIEPIIITEPEYLTEEEARTMRLSPREKIQVLERDEEGKVLSYKIIRSEEDLVTEFLPAEAATSTPSGGAE